MKILLMYIYTAEYLRVKYQYVTARNIKMLSNGKNMGFNLSSSQPVIGPFNRRLRVGNVTAVCYDDTGE